MEDDVHENENSAIKEARDLYKNTMPDRSLTADLDECLRKGYVFVGPDYLLAGYRVGTGWFISIAVGHGCLKRFIDLMPYYLPWVGWAREPAGKKEVVWRQTEKVIRICETLSKSARRRPSR